MDNSCNHLPTVYLHVKLFYTLHQPLISTSNVFQLFTTIALHLVNHSLFLYPFGVKSMAQHISPAAVQVNFKISWMKQHLLGKRLCKRQLLFIGLSLSLKTKDSRKGRKCVYRHNNQFHEQIRIHSSILSFLIKLTKIQS